jgi:hypothetical protein
MHTLHVQSMSEAVTETITSATPEQQLRRQEAAWLFGATVVGYGLLAIYALHYSSAEPVTGAHIRLAMDLIYFVGVPIGAFLTPRAGLPGAPALTRWLGGDPALPFRWRSVGWGLLLGWALFVVVILLENLAIRQLGLPFKNFGVANQLQLRSRLLYGFITSFGAPLFEEPSERLFLFSLFAWILQRVWRARSGGIALLWTANLLQGLITGTLHVLAGATNLPVGPWYLQMLISPQTWFSVALGAVYWRYGLETSMIMHFTAAFYGLVILPWLRVA